MSVAGVGAVGAGLTALAVWQAAPGAGALDRLADQWPLVAVLVGGLYLLFRAYQALTARLVDVITNNTRAFTENTAATRANVDATLELRRTIEVIHARVNDLGRRLDRLEDSSGHHPRGRGTP